jgi:hypothetical protein
LEQLPIVALEFIAWIISLIMFYKFVQHHHGVVLCSDSHTSVLVVQNDTAHAALMQSLHSMLLDTYEFQQLRHRLLVGHVFSEGNTMADHDSRGRFKQCKLVAAQLGIRLRTLPAPPRVWAICNINFADELSQRPTLLKTELGITASCESNESSAAVDGALASNNICLGNLSHANDVGEWTDVRCDRHSALGNPFLMG